MIFLRASLRNVSVTLPCAIKCALCGQVFINPARLTWDRPPFQTPRAPSGPRMLRTSNRSVKIGNVILESKIILSKDNNNSRNNNNPCTSTAFRQSQRSLEFFAREIRADSESESKRRRRNMFRRALTTHIVAEIHAGKCRKKCVKLSAEKAARETLAGTPSRTGWRSGRSCTSYRRCAETEEGREGTREYAT